MKVLPAQTLLWAHGLQPTRLLCPWDFPGENTETQVLLNPETTPMMEGQMTLCPFFRRGIWDPEHRRFLLNLKTGKRAEPPTLSLHAPSSKGPASLLSAPTAPPAEAPWCLLSQLHCAVNYEFPWASRWHKTPSERKVFVSVLLGSLTVTGKTTAGSSSLLPRSLIDPWTSLSNQMPKSNIVTSSSNSYNSGWKIKNSSLGSNSRNENADQLVRGVFHSVSFIWANWQSNPMPEAEMHAWPQANCLTPLAVRKTHHQSCLRLSNSIFFFFPHFEGNWDAPWRTRASHWCSSVLCRTWSGWQRPGWTSSPSTFTSGARSTGTCPLGTSQRRRSCADSSSARTSSGSWQPWPGTCPSTTLRWSPRLRPGVRWGARLSSPLWKTKNLSPTPRPQMGAAEALCSLAQQSVKVGWNHLW